MRDIRNWSIDRSRFESLIEPMIVDDNRKLGRPCKISNYNLFCGILYVLRTGVPWRDLPKEFGNWHIIYTRYRRWSERGMFWNLLAKLQGMKEVLMDVVFVDGSIVPLYKHGGGSLKK